MKSILVVDDLKPLITEALAFLHRSDTEVRTASSNEDILRSHMDRAASLIVTRPDLKGMTCETLFVVIRRGERTKRVSLLLLCDTSPHHQEIAGRCGANAVITMPIEIPRLASRISQLLDVPPRLPYSALLNITVDGLHRYRAVMCNAVNISATGMLIKARQPLSTSDHVACSFFLPDGTRISASGEIVRSFRLATDLGASRYGIRFDSLAPGGETAVSAFIAREQKLRSAQGHHAA